jgi:hypothetical protein
MTRMARVGTLKIICLFLIRVVLESVRLSCLLEDEIIFSAALAGPSSKWQLVNNQNNSICSTDIYT